MSGNRYSLEFQSMSKWNPLVKRSKVLGLKPPTNERIKKTENDV